jgi:hypothetical protein
MKTFLNFKILILLLIAGFCMTTIPKVWPQAPVFDIGNVCQADKPIPAGVTCYDEFVWVQQQGDYLIICNRTENASVSVEIPRPKTNMMYYGGTVPANSEVRIKIKYLQTRHKNQLLDVNYTLSMKMNRKTVFSAPKNLKILIKEGI